MFRDVPVSERKEPLLSMAGGAGVGDGVGSGVAVGVGAALGAVEGVLCERQGLAAAYAFLLRAPATKSLLLLLYAVEPEMRGSGVGSDFLRALLERAPGAAGLYAEVEKEELAPDAGAAHRLLRAAGLFARRGAVLLSSTAPWPIPAIRMPRPLRARPCPD